MRLAHRFVARAAAAAALPLCLFALGGCSKLRGMSGGGDAGAAAASSSSSATASAATPSPPPAVPSTITFTKQDPAVGGTFTEVETVDTQFQVDTPTKQTVDESSKTSKKVEIVAASGKAVTKVKVSYTAANIKNVDNGVNKTTTSQVTGNTYLVEAAAGGVKVTDPNNKPVSAAESAFVGGDFATIGRPDQILAHLPDTPLKVGDSADSIAEALRDAFASNGDLTQSSITLQQITPDGNGVFGVKLGFTQKRPNGLALAFTLAGTMTVRSSDSRLLATNIKGAITVGGTGKGTGTFATTDALTY